MPRQYGYMWAVRYGAIGSAGHVVSVYDRKADAVKDIKEYGYTFDKKHGLYRGSDTFYILEQINRNEL